MFCRQLCLIEFHTVLSVFTKLSEVVYLGSSRNRKIWGKLDCIVWRVYGKALRPDHAGPLVRQCMASSHVFHQQASSSF